MNDFLQGYRYCFDEFKKLKQVNPQMPLEKAIEEAEKRAKETFLAKPKVIVTKFDKKADCIVVDEERTMNLHLQDIIETLGKEATPQEPAKLITNFVHPYTIKENSKEGCCLIEGMNRKNLTHSQKVSEAMMFFQQCNPDGLNENQDWLDKHIDNLFVNIHQICYVIEHTNEEILTDFCKKTFGKEELPMVEVMTTLANEKKLISY